MAEHLKKPTPGHEAGCVHCLLKVMAQHWCDADVVPPQTMIQILIQVATEIISGCPDPLLRITLVQEAHKRLQCSGLDARRAEAAKPRETMQ